MGKRLWQLDEIDSVQDADEVAILDKSGGGANGKSKKGSWSKIYTYLKSKFDLVYAPIGGGGPGTDTTAIHDNVAGEIATITEKVTSIDSDILVIEDSADSNNKKRVQLGNLPITAAKNVTGKIVKPKTTEGDILSNIQDAKARLTPITLSEVDYESLTEYENRVYDVLNVGTYDEYKFMGALVWRYEASDYHVATTGNDGTGDGSFGNPWLTISHAIDQLAAAGGETIWVHEGTYAEDDGGGYLNKNNLSFTNRSYLKAQPNARVIITNVSGSYVLRFGGTSNKFTIKGFELQASGAVNNFFNISGSAVINSFEVVDCYFNDTQTTGISVQMTGSIDSSDVQFKRNTFNSAGAFYFLLQACDGISIIGNSFLSTTTASPNIFRLHTGTFGIININNNFVSLPNAGATSCCVNQTGVFDTTGIVVTINRNWFDTNGRGIFIDGGDVVGNSPVLNINRNWIRTQDYGVGIAENVKDGTISYNYIEANADYSLSLPNDNADTGAVTGFTVNYNHLVGRGNLTHTFLLGANGDNNTCQYNLIDGSNSLASYAAVIKGDTNIFNNNVVYGGTNSALYLKGADSCTANDNTIYSAKSTAVALRLEEGSGSEPIINNTVQNNLFLISDGELYNFLTSVLGTGNDINNNVYDLDSPATFGTMFSLSVTSLEDVRASWVSYYALDNDDNSEDF